MKRYNLIPYPRRIKELPGSFTLTEHTKLIAAGDATQTARQFAQWIFPATGWQLSIETQPSEESARIVFALDDERSDLGEEGYTLEVLPTRISLKAKTRRGLHYAAQTLRQLMPPQIFSTTKIPSFHWEIPCVEIQDQPRFSWRGSMLDVCRHFMPLEFIYKYLDLLALHKMNTFHWHLTEDQGWRIEIKRYPRLTEIGGWRKETLIGHYEANRDHPKYDGKPHGGYYTQEQIKDVVAYAEKLGINIVPEIEMPGHAQAAIAAYPFLGNSSEPVEVSTHWGIHTHIFNVEESTLEFLQNVLDEVLALFPSVWIHIGGDEVPKKEWKESPRAQQKMRELGLKNEEELQSYFIRRIDQFLTQRGRRLVGWDEILEGGLAPNATVMSWRGEAGGIAAAQAGHQVVMAPNTYTYLDYYQSENRDSEPLAIGGFLPLQKVYSYEPIPPSLDPAYAPNILGTQGQIWTEYIQGPAQAEYMAFPRLCALSEVAWTPPEKKDYGSFLERLNVHLKRLDYLKVNYRMPEELDLS